MKSRQQTVLWFVLTLFPNPLRDIVLASNLKPLDRKDKAEAPCKQPWNALASADKGQNQTSCDEIGLKVRLLPPHTNTNISPFSYQGSTQRM